MSLVSTTRSSIVALAFCRFGVFARMLVCGSNRSTAAMRKSLKWRMSGWVEWGGWVLRNGWLMTDEPQLVVDASGQFLGIVGDHDERLVVTLNKGVDDVFHQPAVAVVETM